MTDSVSDLRSLALWHTSAASIYPRGSMRYLEHTAKSDVCKRAAVELEALRSSLVGDPQR